MRLGLRRSGPSDPAAGGRTPRDSSAGKVARLQKIVERERAAHRRALDEQLEAARSERRALSQAHRGEIERVLAAAAARVEAATNQLRQLEASLAQSETAVAERDAETSRLNNQLDHARAEIETGAARLSEAVEAGSVAAAMLDETRAALADRNHEVERLHSELGLLRGQLEALETNLREETGTRGEAERKLAETSAALSDTRALLSETRTRLADTLGSLEEARASVAQRDGEAEKLAAELSTMRGDLEALAIRSREDADARAHAEGRCEELEDELAFVRSSVTAAGSGGRRGLLRRGSKPARSKPSPHQVTRPVEATVALVDDDTAALLERRLSG